MGEGYGYRSRWGGGMGSGWGSGCGNVHVSEGVAGIKTQMVGGAVGCRTEDGAGVIPDDEKNKNKRRWAA